MFAETVSHAVKRDPLSNRTSWSTSRAGKPSQASVNMHSSVEAERYADVGGASKNSECWPWTLYEQRFCPRWWIKGLLGSLHIYFNWGEKDIVLQNVYISIASTSLFPSCTSTKSPGLNVYVVIGLRQPHDVAVNRRSQPSPFSCRCGRVVLWLHIHWTAFI